MRMSSYSCEIEQFLERTLEVSDSRFWKARSGPEKICLVHCRCIEVLHDRARQGNRNRRPSLLGVEEKLPAVNSCALEANCILDAEAGVPQKSDKRTHPRLILLAVDSSVWICLRRFDNLFVLRVAEGKGWGEGHFRRFERQCGILPQKVPLDAEPKECTHPFKFFPG